MTSVCSRRTNNKPSLFSWLKITGMQHLWDILLSVLCNYTVMLDLVHRGWITCSISSRFHIWFLISSEKWSAVINVYGFCSDISHNFPFIIELETKPYTDVSVKLTFALTAVFISFKLYFPEWIYFGSALHCNKLCQQHWLATRWLNIMWAPHSSACCRLSGWAPRQRKDANELTHTGKNP